MYKKYIFFFLLSFGVSVSLPAEAKVATTTPLSQEETEEEIREYFSDLPVMIEIARCESNFRQFTDSGNVLQGGTGGGMIGVFQFFGSIHESAAEKIGFDIDTLDGNLAYARHLYEVEGTTPWNPAKNCWDTVKSVSKPTTINTKEIAILKKKVALLIQLLDLMQKLQAKSA